MKFEYNLFKIILLISLLFVFVKSEIENDKSESSIESNSTNKMWKDNEVDRLKRDLLKDYEKNAKPSKNPLVTLCVNARHIDLDEHNGIFKIYLWLVVEWKDPKLAWDPNNYSNITAINFAAHEIWEPEIVSFNSVDPTAESYADTLMIAYNNGKMLRVPPYEYKVFCDMNFALWPYDKQNCSVKLGTWASREIKIVADNKSHCLQIEDDMTVNEWKLEKKYSKNGTDPFTKFDYAEFSFEMQRQSPLYKAIIITPTSCIVLMILSAFWLPPQCGEKIILNSVNALLILAFLMYFGQLLPILADHTPLIVLFLSSSLLLVSISMIISVIVIYIADINHEKRIPKWLKNLLSGLFGKILLLSHLNKNHAEIVNEDDDQKVDGTSSQDPQLFELTLANSSSKKAIQNDWIIFATAIDRFSFLIYCVIFIVLAIKYSV